MKKILIDGQILATPEMQRGIGEVFLHLLHGMLPYDQFLDWSMVVRDEKDIARLSPFIQKFLKIHVLPSTAITHASNYSTQIQELIDQHQFNYYWNPNPLMLNVYYAHKLKNVITICTLFDLIPKLFPDLYLDRWTDKERQDYASRLSDLAQHVNHIVAISKTTARDFIQFFPEAQKSMQVVQLGADFSIMWPYKTGIIFAKKRYVLYTGGMDPRKNMVRAIEAFGQFWHGLPEEDKDIRFKLMCAYSPDEYAALLPVMEKMQIQTQIDFTGYVSKERLGALFRECAIFFYPSLYEGFGLPVLDALACGVPVVTSCQSALTEIAGSQAYYCDPYQVEDMAIKLNSAWSARKLCLIPWMENVKHARKWHWNKTCLNYLNIFRGQRLLNTRSHTDKIAYLSPWPPQQNGIGDYSFLLVKELSQFCEIVVYTTASLPMPLNNIIIKPIEDYFIEYQDYAIAIYHIGNNLDCQEIYRAAYQIPGVVVMHDFNIHFMLESAFLAEKTAYYREALLWYGEKGANAWENYTSLKIKPDIFSFPMSHALVARSKSVIVHSRWVAQQFASLNTPIFISHLGAEKISLETMREKNELYAKLKLDKNKYYIGIFGFINHCKRLPSIIAVIQKLQQEGYPVILLIVGKVLDANFPDMMHDPQKILHMGYVSQEEFNEYLQIADIVINLRYPTMGESSATLFNAFAFGKACITSNINQFAELPDNVVWKCDVNENETQQLETYIRHLLENPQTRNKLGSNAQQFVEEFATLTEVAKTYLLAMNNKATV